MKVLVVDDEKMLAEMLTEVLKRSKIDCDAVYDGQAAIDYALTGNYDLIVLDIMIPKVNGLDVLKTLRKKSLSTPILLLSAKSEVTDKIEGLDTGADDYLTKPFATGEFIARVKALSRRKTEFTGDILTYGDFSLNKNAFTLNCGDSSIQLSNTEYKIMEILISNPRTVVNKGRLVEKVWGWDNESEYNSAEVYISFLRKKLSAIGSAVGIRSVRGIGYTLSSEEL